MLRDVAQHSMRHFTPFCWHLMSILLHLRQLRRLVAAYLAAARMILYASHSYCLPFFSASTHSLSLSISVFIQPKGIFMSSDPVYEFSNMPF